MYIEKFKIHNFTAAIIVCVLVGKCLNKKITKFALEILQDHLQETLYYTTENCLKVSNDS